MIQIINDLIIESKSINKTNKELLIKTFNKILKNRLRLKSLKVNGFFENRTFLKRINTKRLLIKKIKKNNITNNYETLLNILKLKEDYHSYNYLNNNLLKKYITKKEILKQYVTTDDFFNNNYSIAKFIMDNAFYQTYEYELIYLTITIIIKIIKQRKNPIFIIEIKENRNDNIIFTKSI